MSKSPEPPTLTVAELARRLGRRHQGRGNALVKGFASLDTAGPGDLVFLENSRRKPDLDASGASVALIPAGMAYDRIPVIPSKTPRMDFVRAEAFFLSPEKPEPGIHATAQVASSARLAGDVSVGAFCFIGEDVEIGAGGVISPLVSIYSGVRIGRDCRLHSHVSLRENVTLGDRVVLHNGVVVGADGFGYLQDEEKRSVKIPQTGSVIIGDDVEIGANSTIDRATLGDTIVRRGVKIDNLVQVGHNVLIGEDSVLMAQVGIAGSSRIGRNSMLCGQAGVADHVTIGENVIVAAKTGVTKSIPPGSIVSGIPHLDIREWRKAWAAIPQLYELIKDIRRLKQRIEELEKQR